MILTYYVLSLYLCKILLVFPPADLLAFPIEIF